MAVLGACGGGNDSTASAAAAPATPAAATLADKVAVGDKLFHEVQLSAGGNLACATCHVEGRGHADAEGTFLPLGGARLDQQGLRSSPSVRYLNANTAFRFDGQGARRFSEAPAAQILHHRHAGTEAERAGEVKARYAGHFRYAVERELFVEVRFDVPEGATEGSGAGRHAGRQAVRLR